MADLDLAAAIEAAASAIDDEIGRQNIDTSASGLADAAVRAAAPLIVEQARREPFNWRQVGWVNLPGGRFSASPPDVTDLGFWRRVYVMLTSEDRAAVHGVQVGDLP